jgi:AAA15 family ATPase/GTPase
MIRIIDLEIKNYRSCINTKIEINNDLTTLIGINGVGKSNILNSIQLLKRINRNRYFNQKALQDSLSHSELKFNLKINGEFYILKSDIYYETDERNIDEIYSAELLLKKNGLKKWIPVDADLYEIVDRLRHMGRSNQLHLFHDKKLDTEQGKIIIGLIEYLSNISYYSATQFSDPTKCPISIELEEKRPFRSNRGEKPHDKFIYDLYSTFKNDKKSYRRYIDTVSQNGIGLIDGIDFFEHNMPSSSYEIKSGGKIKTIVRNKNIIIPSIKLDNKTLSPNQLSEGTFKTLALVFYILNDKSELLLIEEPEVCVHHGLLSSIIELIKIQSKQKQIFISTHSDYVLDKLLPENILLVNKDGIKGTFSKSLTKALTKNEYSALKEYLNESGNLGEYWKEGGFENE